MISFVRVAAIFAASIIPSIALSAPKSASTIDRVFIGTRSVGVDNNSIGDASFPSRSAIAAQIFRGGQGCDEGEFCVLRAIVTTAEPHWVRKVLSAKKMPDEKRPEDVIKFVYGSWSSSGFNIHDDDLEKIYTPRLAKLIVDARLRGQKEESEVLDQPFYDGQDGNPVKLKTEVTYSGDESAIVRAVYFVDVDASDEPQRVNFEMNRIEGRWRIADARLSIGANTKLTSFAELLAPPPPPKVATPPVASSPSGPASRSTPSPNVGELPPIWR